MSAKVNAGAKILDGLRDALSGNFAAVTIDGQRSEWQSIETAPKDGTPIWAYRAPADFGKHQCRVEVKWHSWPDIDPLTGEPEAAWVWPCNPVEDIGASGWLNNGDYYESLEFTHWMPLPAPPRSCGRGR